MKKDFFIADLAARAQGLSVEEALANGLNRWESWHCAAGTENIHITADGNIFSATCKVGGLLGNVFDSGSLLPEFWLRCTSSNCACGADMSIRKSKFFDKIPRSASITVRDLTFEDRVTDPEFVGPMHEPTWKLSCTWDLSRRCNYRCHYCNSSISNTYEAHKSWGSLLHAANEVERIFCKGKQTKFIFTGGEPTLNPSYLELVKLLHSRGHVIHTQTNGSLGPEYYSELIQHSFIGFSIHLDFYREDRLLRTIEAVLSQKSRTPKLAETWLGIRIMVTPGRYPEAKSLLDSIKNLPNFSSGRENYVSMSVVYERDNPHALLDYDPSELQCIRQHL